MCLRPKEHPPGGPIGVRPATFMSHSVTLTLPSSNLHTIVLPHHYKNGIYNESNGATVDRRNRSPERTSKSNTSIASNGLRTSTLVEATKSTSLVFVGLLVTWYAVSVGHNLLNKRLLEADLFPYPVTLTLFQLTAITIYSWTYIRIKATRNATSGDPNVHSIVSISEALGKKRNRTLIVFLSLGKFLSLVFSHLSLYQIPLAFTHTGNYII